MSWRRGLALVCLFFLDVHVKAESVHGQCWGNVVPCPVQAGTEKQVITAPDLRISLGPSALLDQRDEKTIQLVKGDFYVETTKPVVFKTPYAKVWCDDDCKGIFIRKSENVDVKNLQGRWLVQRNGESTIYSVPEASQVEVTEVGEDGRASMEFPQSLPWDLTVKQWRALYPGTSKEFRPTLVKFRAAWKSAVESISQMHSQAAARTIAADQDGQAKEQARKLAIERENERLRTLFREKNP